MSVQLEAARWARVEVDKGQMLSLFWHERFVLGDSGLPPIQLLVRASIGGGPEECTISGRLGQTERTEVTALLSGGKHAGASSSARRVCQRLMPAPAMGKLREVAAFVGPPCTKRRFVLGKIEATLREAPCTGAERKPCGRQEALLVATARSKPPDGRAR